jgi:hypothetical protein
MSGKKEQAMSFLQSVKERIKETPAVLPYIWLKNRFNAGHSSQSNEAEIIDRLVSKFDVPKYFVEFGFSGWEFNCYRLAKNTEWEGLLLDGGAYNVVIARKIFHKNIVAKQMWINLETLDVIFEHSKNRNLGILSIDVDGNDYWFLQRLISLNPAIIISEFNVSFGTRSISVPYDQSFDRTKKHESHEYYGASLSAISFICYKYNYSLVDVSKNGINAFFVRNDLLAGFDEELQLDDVLLVKTYPDGSEAPTSVFWQAIKHMPYVDVTKIGANCEDKGEVLFV